jgi:hypothetical protein
VGFHLSDDNQERTGWIGSDRYHLKVLASFIRDITGYSYLVSPLVTLGIMRMAPCIFMGGLTSATSECVALSSLIQFRVRG